MQGNISVYKQYLRNINIKFWSFLSNIAAAFIVYIQSTL